MRCSLLSIRWAVKYASLEASHSPRRQCQDTLLSPMAARPATTLSTVRVGSDVETASLKLLVGLGTRSDGIVIFRVTLENSTLGKMRLGNSTGMTGIVNEMNNGEQ